MSQVVVQNILKMLDEFQCGLRSQHGGSVQQLQRRISCLFESIRNEAGASSLGQWQGEIGMENEQNGCWLLNRKVKGNGKSIPIQMFNQQEQSRNFLQLKLHDITCAHAGLADCIEQLKSMNLLKKQANVHLSHDTYRGLKASRNNSEKQEPLVKLKEGLDQIKYYVERIQQYGRKMVKCQKQTNNFQPLVFKNILEQKLEQFQLLGQQNQQFQILGQQNQQFQLLEQQSQQIFQQSIFDQE